MTNAPALPAGSNTVNPFIWATDAVGLIDFVIEVFGAIDVPEARTLDTDGLVLHSELLIGDSMITIAGSKPGWPFTPSFLRVYVDDVTGTLARGEAAGGEIVTRPTEFFGDTLSRLADPFGNLWWVYSHDPAAAAAWGGEGDSTEAWGATDADGGEAAADDDWSAFSSPELDYIHSSLIEAMQRLRDPRA